MIVVNFSDAGLASVFALELDTLVWHEFCSPGITLARPRDVKTIAKPVPR
jgi:hypothetical protein